MNDELSLLTISLGIFFFCGVTFLATWFWLSAEINSLKSALSMAHFDLQNANNCLKMEVQNRDYILAQFQQSSLETMRAIRQLSQASSDLLPKPSNSKPITVASEEYKSSLEFAGGLQ
jgi:hypothetical protein